MLCKPKGIQVTEVINCSAVCLNIILPTEPNFMGVISLQLSGPVIIIIIFV
jgi:hypothetical protein